MLPGLGTDLNLDLDPLLVQVPIEIEADVTDAMSTITLPKNVLIIMPKVEVSHSTKDSLLRMTDNDPAYTLNYADREDFDLDLNM